MQSNISKVCADHLRSYSLYVTGQKLKATHARELVAAFFGYKSHAALLAEKNYPLSNLEASEILVPDIPLFEIRTGKLNGLPTSWPSAKHLCAELVSFLQSHGLFTGKAWVYGSLQEYVIEVYLPEEDAQVSNELSGVMAETNAYFDETYYEEAEVISGPDDVTVVATGQLNGQSDPDKMFCGDSIDMEVTVEMPRVAGRSAFSEPDISAHGQVNDDWVDPEIRYGRTP